MKGMKVLTTVWIDLYCVRNCWVFTLWWENENWRTCEGNQMASLLNTACTSPLAMCSLSKSLNPINFRSASPIVLHVCLSSLDIYFLDIARMNWTNKGKIELSLSLLGQQHHKGWPWQPNIVILLTHRKPCMKEQSRRDGSWAYEHEICPGPFPKPHPFLYGSNLLTSFVLLKDHMPLQWISLKTWNRTTIYGDISMD